MKLPDTLTTNERLFLRKNEKSYLIFCENKRFTVGYESAKAFLDNKEYDFIGFEYGITERSKLYKKRIRFQQYIDTLPDPGRLTVRKLEEASLFFNLYARRQNWSRTEINLDEEEMGLFKELFNNVWILNYWRRSSYWATVHKVKQERLIDNINRLQEIISSKYSNTVILSLTDLYELSDGVAWRIIKWD